MDLCPRNINHTHELLNGGSVFELQRGQVLKIGNIASMPAPCCTLPGKGIRHMYV